MKVLFTGTGSIGSRHIINLYNNCRAKNIPLTIDVIRYSNRILPDNIKTKIRNEINDDKKLDTSYDVLFVTEGTKTHFDTILKYRPICKHMFIEKPIFDTPYYPIEKITPLTPDAIYYVAAPIRFTHYYQKLKEVLNKNEIYSIRIIFSSYMPDWQANRDYRKSFRCSVNKGGGVDIDLIHEIDYMTSLLGKPQKVHRIAGKFSNLEMDACDLAIYMFEYPDKLVELHLDYFGRIRTRKVELYTKDDVIVVDFNEFKCYYLKSGKIESYNADDQFYQDEMDYFVNMITSENNIVNINTPQNAYETLKLSKGIID